MHLRRIDVKIVYKRYSCTYERTCIIDELKRQSLKTAKSDVVDDDNDHKKYLD